MTAQASTAAPLTMDQLAAVIAHDIPEGSYVNLGIGQPTKIADHLPKDESGVLFRGIKLNWPNAPTLEQQEADRARPARLAYALT